MRARTVMSGLGSTMTVLALLASGCGKGAPGEVAAASSKAGSGAIQPCQLLTSQEVATVLADHDGGFVAHAGGSLIQGVDAFQCSYSNPSTEVLTVILNLAVDDERWAAIEPSRSRHEDHQQIEVGEWGWVWGQADDLKISAGKGRTLIDLELFAPDAKQRSAALIALARAVAERLP